MNAYARRLQARQLKAAQRRAAVRDSRLAHAHAVMKHVEQVYESVGKSAPRILYNQRTGRYWLLGRGHTEAQLLQRAQRIEATAREASEENS